MSQQAGTQKLKRLMKNQTNKITKQYKPEATHFPGSPQATIGRCCSRENSHLAATRGSPNRTGKPCEVSRGGRDLQGGHSARGATPTLVAACCGMRTWRARRSVSAKRIIGSRLSVVRLLLVPMTRVPIVKSVCIFWKKSKTRRPWSI